MNVIRRGAAGPAWHLPLALDRLLTPCLILDLDALDRNIAAMASLTRRCGIALRPHAKVHKSSAIVRRQLAAGAIGQCCATLGEAEALAAAGISGLLITSPLVGHAMIERLLALQDGSGPAVVVDHGDNLAALAAAAHRAKKRLPVLVDLDVGQRRTGVTGIEDAVALARAAAASPSLAYRGVQAYWGQLQGLAGEVVRKAAVRDRSAWLSSVLDALKQAGLSPEIVTGGGTGTATIDAGLGLFTEIQPGSYALMDGFYADERLWDGGAAPGETALAVRCHVIAKNKEGEAILNAGTKAFGSDVEPPRLPRRLLPGRGLRFMGDEHAAISGTASTLNTGDALHLTPNFGAQAIALYARYFGVRGAQVVEILEIDAHGR